MAKNYVLFEGDSWFAHPHEPQKNLSNIYQEFLFINEGRPARKKYTIHYAENPANLSQKKYALPKNGDTIAKMVLNNNKLLWDAINKQHKNMLAVVISGGGNDLINNISPPRGARSRSILKTYSKHYQKPSDCIDQEEFGLVLHTIGNKYKKLADVCAKKRIHLITHDYTQLKPNGTANPSVFGFASLLGAGPWIRPAFRSKRYFDGEGKMKRPLQPIVNYVMREFSEKLHSVSEDNPYFHIIPTQRMTGLNKHLIDEIHLNQTGCKRVARAILRKLDKIRKPLQPLSPPRRN